MGLVLAIRHLEVLVALLAPFVDVLAAAQTNVGAPPSALALELASVIPPVDHSFQEFVLIYGF